MQSRTICVASHSSQKVYAEVDEAWKGISRSEIHHQVGTGRSRAVVALEMVVKVFSQLVEKGREKGEIQGWGRRDRPLRSGRR